MSRMLAALKQIEARSSARLVASPPVDLGSWLGQEADLKVVREARSSAAVTVLMDKPQLPPECPEASEVQSAVMTEEPPLAPVAPPIPHELPPLTDAEVTLSAIEAAVAMADELADLPTNWPAELSRGPYAELAQAILARLPRTGRAVLMFTSACPGEGKTATLARLAPALAERAAGEVLAIDANLRTPGLAAHWGIGGVRGLPDVLRGTAGWPEVIRRTDTARLSVLIGGKWDAEGQLPAGLDLRPLVDEIKWRYQLVLVDTASLVYPEVAPIAAHCDGVYLIVPLGQTTRRILRQSARAIRACRGRLLGAVVGGRSE